MRLVYIPANLTEIKKFGIIPVLIQQLLKKEVDIVPYAFAPTPELWKHVDFSIPLGIEYYNLLQQYPKTENRLTAIIRPFSLTVWVLFIISFVIMVIFIALITHYNQQIKDFKSKSLMNIVNRYAIYMLTVITGQGNHLSSKEKFSLRLAVGLWCLTMIVLVNAYSGTLTSYLTVPKLVPIVNTFAELSKANSGPYKVFGNSLRNNPQLLVKGGNIFEGMKNVLERNAAYFTNRVAVQYMMALDMQTHSNCRLTASDPIPYMDYYSAALPQGSRHNWIINHE
uniref:Ionotropic glutamate receptor C-terminal domain-containing protein n=1 Tax=Daphnia galeata TaxID=27404 RepID=A0A8J2WR41_9CRUS|nr:unnamed protein product [Daphnia galeata]